MTFRIDKRHLPLLGVAVFALVLGWILGFGAHRGFWTQETAAWVQGLGSIAALGIAIWLPYAERYRRDAELKRGLAALYQEAIKQIILLDMFVRDPEARATLSRTGLPEHAFENLGQSFSAFPIWDIADEVVVEKIHGIRGALGTVIGIARRIVDPRSNPTAIEADLRALWHTVDQSKEDARDLSKHLGASIFIPNVDVGAFRRATIEEAQAKGWPRGRSSSQ